MIDWCPVNPQTLATIPQDVMVLVFRPSLPPGSLLRCQTIPGNLVDGDALITHWARVNEPADAAPYRPAQPLSAIAPPDVHYPSGYGHGGAHRRTRATLDPAACVTYAPAELAGDDDEGKE